MKRALFLSLLLASAWTSHAQNRARFSDIKPGMKNCWLEAEAIHLANQWATDTRCPEEYTQAVIISEDWEPYYNKYGDPIGRKILIELYCIRGNERCGIADFTFRQRIMDDGNYSRKLTCKRVGDMVWIDCE